MLSLQLRDPNHKKKVPHRVILLVDEKHCMVSSHTYNVVFVLVWAPIALPPLRWQGCTIIDIVKCLFSNQNPFLSKESGENCVGYASCDLGHQNLKIKLVMIVKIFHNLKKGAVVAILAGKRGGPPFLTLCEF
jgi:hypothetical protein